MSDIKPLIPLAPGLVLRDAVNTDAEAIRELFAFVHNEYGFTLDFDGRDGDLNDIGVNYPEDTSWFGVVLDIDNEKLAGTVALKPVNPAYFKNDKSVIELGRLYLYPQYRGQGLGSKLMQAAIDKARALGYRRMVLESHSKMSGAILLYDKFGFREIAPFSEAGKKDWAYCDYAAELLL